MVRTAIALQVISRFDFTPTYAAANVDGHSFLNTDVGFRFIEVKNTSGTECTVTILTPAMMEGLAVSDHVFTVPATTGVKRVGPFSASTYNQPDNTVHINFSAVDGVTVAVFQISP